MTSKKHGVIFDLDGVIIDSSAVMKTAFEYAFKSFYPDREAPFDIYSMHAGKGFLKIMHEMNLPEAMLPLFQAKSIELMSNITLFDGIAPLIVELKMNNCYLGIATGKDSLRTQQILRDKALLNYFDKIVCCDDVNQGKPDPESIQAHLNFADINADKILFIGDSVADLQCAKKANVKAVAALWGMGKLNALVRELPDYIAFNVHDLRWIFGLRGLLNLALLREQAS